MSIQRYNTENHLDHWEADEGMWVFYMDHAAEVRRLREALANIYSSIPDGNLSHDIANALLGQIKDGAEKALAGEVEEKRGGA